VIRWEEHVARVEHLRAGVDHDELRRLVVDIDKVGIDVPFGWPDAFVTSVESAHREGWIALPLVGSLDQLAREGWR
jgi:hypothetical protein